MRITLNVTAMRQAFALVPYPGPSQALSTLSTLLLLRMHKTAMVLLVVGQPLHNLPVVPPKLKRRSAVNATLHCPLWTQLITPLYPPRLNFLMAVGEGETPRLRRVLALSSSHPTFMRPLPVPHMLVVISLLRPVPPQIRPNQHPSRMLSIHPRICTRRLMQIHCSNLTRYLTLPNP